MSNRFFKTSNFIISYLMTTSKRLAACLWLLTAIPGLSQQQMLLPALTTRLDSVSMCPGNERYFGELYLQATISVERYIESLSGQDKLLMRTLEERFAMYFFRAIDSNKKGAEVPDEWKNYFTGKYSPLQLKLLGANAHINGDIWQALTENFSLVQIKQLTRIYKNYDRFIKTIYDALFEQGIRSDKRLHDLHWITLGLDKLYGRIMLRKWRNRQLKLAIFKFEDEEGFRLLKNKIDKKRNRIDQMIIRRLDVNE